MPHVVIKMKEGRTEEQKKALADAIAKDVMSILNVREASVSVAIQDVKADDWQAKVYELEIAPNKGKLHKEPGYGGP